MPDNVREIFTRNLNELMERRSVTQNDIAEALGVSGATVSYWCTGKKCPRIDVMQRLADWFGVGVDVFLHENGMQTVVDMDRLEALHQNPRLGMLFDRQREMSESDIDMIYGLVDRILKERDGE